MLFSSSGMALLKTFEAMRTKAYRDQHGVWTVGYGSTQGVTATTSVNEATAVAWLNRDASRAARAVRDLVTVPLSQDQFDALVCFVYNIGASAFRISTMRKRLNESNFGAAAAEFPKWDHAGDLVSAGLLSRRQRELALFEAHA